MHDGEPNSVQDQMHEEGRTEFGPRPTKAHYEKPTVSVRFTDSQSVSLCPSLEKTAHQTAIGSEVVRLGVNVFKIIEILHVIIKSQVRMSRTPVPAVSELSKRETERSVTGMKRLRERGRK